MMPNVPRRTRWLGFAVLVVTFTVGASAGAAFDRIVAVNAVVDAPVAEEAARPVDPAILEGNIYDHIDLSPEQRESIDSILARRKAEMDSIWDEVGPSMRKLARGANAEIRALLSAEQREEYVRIRAERRRAERERCTQERNDTEKQSR